QLPVARLLVGEGGDIEAGQRRVAGRVHLVRDELARLAAVAVGLAADVAAGAQLGAADGVAQVGQAVALLLLLGRQAAELDGADHGAVPDDPFGVGAVAGDAADAL